MARPVAVRPLREADRPAWEALWDGYNAFYGRSGETALPRALVAEADGALLGLTHYLFHRSTTRIALTCYLQDLFTAPAERGRGIGRALIAGVYQRAKAAGITRVSWQTQATNAAGRMLYDKVAEHAGFIVSSTDLDR